jgi:lipopolysaccharide heptosyltransferase II
MFELPPADWTHIRELLCVRLDAIGDVLMTGPALRALRAGGPHRRITLLTSPAGAEAAALMPEVDDTIVYSAPWMKTERAATAAVDRAMAELLRARRFDAAAIFTVYTQSPLPAALLCHLAGIPLRLAHCRENPYLLLTDWIAETEPDDGVRHEVRRQLDLVAGIGARATGERLSLAVPDAARERVRERLANLGLEPGRSWVVLHPGATADSRRYPPDGWSQVCRMLTRDHGLTVLLTGGGDEEAGLASAVSTSAGAGVAVTDLPGLADLAALLEATPVLLAGNTGPVHVAAAVGTPVVDVYALTNPQHTPWEVPSRVLFQDVPCRWCYRSICPEGHHRCVRGVSPDQIVAAALSLLRGEPGSEVSLPPVPPEPPRRNVRTSASGASTST